MKVTPDKEAPTIPKATRYQGEFELALKKASLESLFPVMYEITNSKPK